MQSLSDYDAVSLFFYESAEESKTNLWFLSVIAKDCELLWKDICKLLHKGVVGQMAIHKGSKILVVLKDRLKLSLLRIDST